VMAPNKQNLLTSSEVELMETVVITNLPSGLLKLLTSSEVELMETFSVRSIACCRRVCWRFWLPRKLN